MRWRAIAILGVLFVSVVAARLPASLLVNRLPAGLSCPQLRGTIWRGDCGALALRGQSLGQLSWQLRFLPLLTGHAALRLQFRASGFSLDTDLDAARDGSLNFAALTSEGQLVALAPLLRAVGARVPAGFGGRVRATLPSLRLTPTGGVHGVRGEIQVDELAQAAAPQALGSWTLVFDGAANSAQEPVGQLTDRGGPFDFKGTLCLTGAPGFRLEGALAARAGLPPEVVNALRFLGTADAAGRRPFVMDGTF
jgi:Type II secretion system (T2SS), protein N